MLEELKEEVNWARIGAVEEDVWNITIREVVMVCTQRGIVQCKENSLPASMTWHP